MAVSDSEGHGWHTTLMIVFIKLTNIEIRLHDMSMLQRYKYTREHGYFAVRHVGNTMLGGMSLFPLNSSEEALLTGIIASLGPKFTFKS
jgi:hypothetical protein